MPGCGVHLVLAARVLGAGPGSETDAARAAFFTGALAPDMGYFPGGDRFASDLAHHVRTGQLVRALARSASGSTAAAFARGWAAHVLADVLVHPLVNRAAAELSRGTSPDDHVDHIRVEQGLDAVLSARFGASALWPQARAHLPTVVQQLAAAYRETYRFAPLERELTASGRAIARGVPLLLRYGRVAVRAIEGRSLPALAIGGAFAAARLATALAPQRPIYAFSRPCRPSEQLTTEVLKVFEEFPARFAALEASRFADLIDYNLDTGEPEDVPYPPAHATRERLRALAPPTG